MLKFILFSLFMFGLIFFSSSSFSADRIPTSHCPGRFEGCKVIGTGVGGHQVELKPRNREILAQGKQEGGTGDTDQIMVQPRKEQPSMEHGCCLLQS
jgi:hypothetical protein